MITEECDLNKICLFCANDYHLEMILLPYIKERIKNSKFIIFTESDLNETIDILLTRINLKDEIKKKIKNIGWGNENKELILEKTINQNKKINVIINGEFNYIKELNRKITQINNKNITVVNCFHVGDINVDIEEIKAEYKYILNTQKI